MSLKRRLQITCNRIPQLLPEEETVLKAVTVSPHCRPYGGLPRLSAIMAASMLLATLGTTVLAQGNSYPQRPLKLIAPTSPGGAPDTIARVLAEKLAPVWLAGRDHVPAFTLYERQRFASVKAFLQHHTAAVGE